VTPILTPKTNFFVTPTPHFTSEGVGMDLVFISHPQPHSLPLMLIEAGFIMCFITLVIEFHPLLSGWP
jgi:hypothetical protein